jgi:hypothetical protein
MSFPAAKFAAFAAKNRYAYHVARRTDLEAILAQGVRPWNHTGNSKFKSTMQARPDHTYWALRGYNLLLEDLPFQAAPGTIDENFIVLRVDLAAFNPALINPDEDALVYDAIDEAGLEALELTSFGQWAHSISLGADEEATVTLVEEHSSFAYNGTVLAQVVEVFEFHRVQTQWGGQWEMVAATVNA